jgi:hypothetical protein
MNKLFNLSEKVVYFAVTIAAVIVGLSQFVYRAWTENDVNETIRKFLNQLFTLIEKVAAAIRTETELAEVQTNE